MKKTLTLALAAAFVALSADAFALRIAQVDVKSVFEKYNGTQSAKDKLKKEVDEEKGKLEKDQDILKKKMSDLEAKKSVLSTEKYKQEQDDLSTEIRALQERIQTTTSDLQKKESDMTAAIVGVIKDAVRDVAKDQKYDFVFDNSTIVYGDADDISAKVVLKLNNK
jgi:outer membrane protein